MAVTSLAAFLGRDLVENGAGFLLSELGQDGGCEILVQGGDLGRRRVRLHLRIDGHHRVAGPF